MFDFNRSPGDPTSEENKRIDAVLLVSFQQIDTAVHAFLQSVLTHAIQNVDAMPSDLNDLTALLDASLTSADISALRARVQMELMLATYELGTLNLPPPRMDHAYYVILYSVWFESSLFLRTLHDVVCTKHVKQ